MLCGHSLHFSQAMKNTLKFKIISTNEGRKKGGAHAKGKNKIKIKNEGKSGEKKEKKSCKKKSWRSLGDV
jgi:hypothetical protein